MISSIMGIPLGLGGGKLKTQEFMSSGTWTKPTDVEVVWALLVGGGGSGARCNSNNYFCLGGGGGEIIFKQIYVKNISSPINVTIGAGGAPATNTYANGANGGNTSFGDSVALAGSGGYLTYYSTSLFRIYPGGGAGGGSKRCLELPCYTGTAYDYNQTSMYINNYGVSTWGGDSYGYAKNDPGRVVVSPLLTSYGGGSAGGGYGTINSYYSYNGGDSFFATGGSGSIPTNNSYGSTGGGASWGNGGNAYNTGVGGSAAANSGGGGGGANGSATASGAGGSGYAIIYWVE